ncbi:flagellar protein FlgN [Microbacterium invictum]|uniref:Flagellar protein FlgN n=1 Tax=Microbacterium invictum TaxID=515415 RepID=A0AA40VM04_9MICO|nr:MULTISPECIES: flagellar protein FlgN [Microbacterium]MBB4139906.1 hypothetical protein [Microbacterium invictum]
MTDVVWVNYSVLERTSNRLGRIIDELEDAGGLADALQDAVGRPFDHSSLRDKVGDFEGRWNDRRGDLVRDITKIHEHVVGVLEGFSGWDTETASQMDIDASGLSDATRPTPA